MNKAEYIHSQGQTRDHHCHWPDCEAQVPPSKLMCDPHWYTLPEDIRNRIWDAFVPGQEIALTPSPEYIAAAREAFRWIRASVATVQ